MSPDGGVAKDDGESFAECFGSVATGVRDADEREILGRKELIDESVALPSVGALVGPVVEFDATEDPAGFMLGEDEVDVLVRDQMEGGLAAAFGADFEEVGEADFDRNPAVRADHGFEDGEKFPFVGSHEVNLFPHQIELSDTAPVMAERQMEREGEQGRAGKETNHQIRAEGNVRSGFGRHGRCGKPDRLGKRSGGRVIGLPFRPAGKGGTDEQRQEHEPEGESLHESGYSPEMKHRGRYAIVRGLGWEGCLSINSGDGSDTPPSGVGHWREFTGRDAP